MCAHVISEWLIYAVIGCRILANRGAVPLKSDVIHNNSSWRGMSCQKRILKSRALPFTSPLNGSDIRERNRERCFKCDQKASSPWFFMTPKEAAGSISMVKSIFLFCFKITSLCILWLVNPVIIGSKALWSLATFLPCALEKDQRLYSNVWWFAGTIAATVFNLQEAAVRRPADFRFLFIWYMFTVFDHLIFIFFSSRIASE